MSNFSVSISFYSALNIQNLSLKVQTVLGEVSVGLLQCTDAGTTEGKYFVCRQMARGMAFRIRKLLGSLFTWKTSVWMNLSPRISAGLSQIASFSTALCSWKEPAPISAVRVLPLHPQLVFGPWQCCLCDSVVPVAAAAAAQRSQLPLPQHLGVPVPGHFQEGSKKANSPSGASTAVCQRRSCLTPWT